MESDLLHYRNRGPEIAGTRITVYNLLPHLLDPTCTEGQLCDAYDLTPRQVAAARAYVLNHYEAVMAEHRRIQSRLDAGNPPEVLEQAREVRGRLKSFREWLAEKQSATDRTPSGVNGAAAAPFPTFHEWLAAREGTATTGAR